MLRVNSKPAARPIVSIAVPFLVEPVLDDVNGFLDLRGWKQSSSLSSPDHGLSSSDTLMTTEGLRLTWCPDLLRTLTKMCVTLGRKEHLSIAASRYCSYSLMWSIVSSDVANMFWRLATECEEVQSELHSSTRVR